MYIYISDAGVFDHIAGIREELRYMGLLREKLRLLYQQADSTTAAPELLRECAEKTRRLEESFQWRIEFLKTLVEDIHRINERTGEIVEDLDRVLGEDGP